MADISELLSNLSPDDMNKLKTIANGIMGNTNSQITKTNDKEKMENMISYIGKMKEDDNRTEFIKRLKPLLSEERQKKADDAIKFLQLTNVAPLLKGML